MKFFVCVFILSVLLVDGVLCRRRGSRRHTKPRLQGVFQTRVPPASQQRLNTNKHQKNEQVPYISPNIQHSRYTRRPLRDGCSLAYDSVPADHIKALLVREDNEAFVYPEELDGVRFLSVGPGSSVTAVCPGSGNRLVLNKRRTARVRCVGGRFFYGRREVTWPDLGCTDKPTPTLKKGGHCGDGGTQFTIGWEVKRSVFIEQVTLCFDEERETTLFSHHSVSGRHIDSKTVEPSRPSFKKGQMFTGDVTSLYRVAQQKRLIKYLLGNPAYLTGQGQHYLAKGHLAPDSDFVLEAEQDATYYYGNVVPQWQSVNNGNWKSLENSLRDLAESHDTSMDVWTGTHGTLELPGVRNFPMEIFLGLSEDKETIPVPAYLWKVVYEPYSNKALALVMVNNVKGEGTMDSRDLLQPPCRDLCPLVPWVDWDVDDVTKGKTFCCSLKDLRSTFENLPDLGRVGVLRS